jgi:two-component system sensor histidine kinase KdpD
MPETPTADTAGKHDERGFAPDLTRTPRLASYLLSFGAVVVTTGLAFLFRGMLPHASLSLLFLTGILIVAARMGLGPGLAASVLSFLAYNFLFTPPQYTLNVDHDGDVATLVFFLIMAAISGNLAARMHREMRQRQASLLRISMMVEFGRRMSSAAQTGDVLTALAEELAEHLDSPVAILMPSENEAELIETARAGPPADTPAGSRAAWRDLSRDPLERDGSLFLKLHTSTGPAGLVVISKAPQKTEAMELARSLVDQAAIALERTMLASDLEDARLTSEREQLRSALLSSLSHDLRTPLAAVIGSTSSIIEYGDHISRADRTELLQNTLGEAQRLDRYIQNLLDMTRIGQGDLKLERNWVDLHDIVASAATRLGHIPGKPPLQVDIPGDLPLLWVHGALVEQALVNLLDNALRYSPPGGRVSISATQGEKALTIEVADEGPGIPAEEQEKVFDMFHTIGGRAEGQGTGLGLAICRSMIAAHEGTVTASTRTDGTGARLRITLPNIIPANTATAG